MFLPGPIVHPPPLILVCSRKGDYEKSWPRTDHYPAPCSKLILYRTGRFIPLFSLITIKTLQQLRYIKIVDTRVRVQFTSKLLRESRVSWQLSASLSICESATCISSSTFYPEFRLPPLRPRLWSPICRAACFDHKSKRGLDGLTESSQGPPVLSDRHQRCAIAPHLSISCRLTPASPRSP